MTEKKTQKRSNIAIQAQQAVVTMDPLTRDFMNSILVVSVLINLAFFIGWVALQVTTQYDAQVAQLLFTR